MAPSSVTAMLKRLDELGLVRYEPYHGVTLTAAGERVALEVIRHHRLIEAFLAETLGMPWDRVHDEAEVLEHYISEDLERRIADKLGEPTPRPPRRPDPDARARPSPRTDTTALPSSRPEPLATFARVSDSDPRMLRYLDRARDPPRRCDCGSPTCEPFGGPVFVEVDGNEHALGRGAGGQDAGGAGGSAHEPHDGNDRRGSARRAAERRRRGTSKTSFPARRRSTALPVRRSRGGHAGVGRIWPFLGPAFIAAVAYIDPGNFATNIAGGAKFGYLLLWVVLAANLIAMLVQTQSAKLGIATGKNLAELCRENFSRRTSLGLWVQAEIVAMSTDVAEVVGAALGLNLLFGIPLFPAALIAGAGAFAILALQQMGFRRLEAAIAVLVGVVARWRSGSRSSPPTRWRPRSPSTS